MSKFFSAKSNFLHHCLVASLCSSTLIDFTAPNQILTSSLKIITLTIAFSIYLKALIFSNSKLTIEFFGLFGILICFLLSSIWNDDIFQPNLIVMLLWSFLYFKVKSIRPIVEISLLHSIFILLFLSTLVIIFHINPKELFFSGEGYWLPFAKPLNESTRQIGV